MRYPSESDFKVPVEGIGDFTFARRRMKDEIDIQREYARIVGGVEPTVWLANMGEYLSTLGVLTVNAPKGWVLDDLDPLDPASYKKLKDVYMALREREETFRSGHASGSEAPGEADGADSGLLVSPEVQPDHP
ncbi:hypothetical protein NAD41_000874 [Salmonella enterica]|nr:hypothetical protein [Salmonella enterica]EKK6596258.1 hypothetical protein [Salmonella enterica]